MASRNWAFRAASSRATNRSWSTCKAELCPAVTQAPCLFWRCGNCLIYKKVVPQYRRLPGSPATRLASAVSLPARVGRGFAVDCACTGAPGWPTTRTPDATAQRRPRKSVRRPGNSRKPGVRGDGTRPPESSAAVEAAVLDGFGHVGGCERARLGEIGNGAGDLEHAVVGAR